MIIISNAALVAGPTRLSPWTCLVYYLHCRHIALTDHQPATICSSVCQSVLMFSTAGCIATTSSWVPSWSCSDVLVHVGRDNIHSLHSGLGLMPSFHQQWHVIPHCQPQHVIPCPLQLPDSLLVCHVMLTVKVLTISSIVCILYPGCRRSVDVAALQQCLLADIPATLVNCFQSVIYAAARAVVGLHRSAHVTDTLIRFHSVCTPVQVQF